MIDSLRRVWRRALAVFRRAPLDVDLDAEIASHLDAAIEDNLRPGMTPEEARRQALVRFGGVARARSSIAKPAVCRRSTSCVRTCASPCARCGATVRLPSSSSLYAGPGDRRERRGLQRGQHHPAAPASLSASRTGWSG